MITRRNALWLIPLLLILAFPLWKIPLASFLAPRGGFDSGDSNRRSEGYNFSMEGVTILQSEEARKTATIHASSAYSGSRPNHYILREVDADIFAENGKLTNVTADTGNYDVGARLLKLIENVFITNLADNYSMQTQLLYYDGADRTVYSPGDTQLRGDGISIDGSSFSHDMISGEYTVGGRVLCLLHGYESS